MLLGNDFIATEQSNFLHLYHWPHSICFARRQKENKAAVNIQEAKKYAIWYLYPRFTNEIIFLVTKLIERDCLKELHHWSRWAQDAVDGHGINFQRLTEHIKFVLNLHHNPSLYGKEGLCSREGACLGDTHNAERLRWSCGACFCGSFLSSVLMPTKRYRLSRIVLVSLFVFIVSVLVEESDQHILRSSHVESLCLRRCFLRAVKRSKTKVTFKSCSLV